MCDVGGHNVSHQRLEYEFGTVIKVSYEGQSVLPLVSEFFGCLFDLVTFVQGVKRKTRTPSLTFNLSKEGWYGPG